MIEVCIPTTDVNSETCVVGSWHVEDGASVQREQLIVEVETSKAVIEITSPADGYLCRGHDEGTEIALGEAVAWILDDPADADQVRARQATAAAEPVAKTYRATKKAEELAQQHDIDLTTLFKGQLITTKDVEQAIPRASEKTYQDLPPVLSADPGIERVMIIGGGFAATQILDILHDHQEKTVVGILDDKKEIWGNTWEDVPIVGGSDRLEELFEARAFDSAIVAISRSIPARTRFREMCGRLGIPMANAIDRTCKIAHTVKIGTGNVICAFCHFGAETEVGDNNFISAYNSFDHHCVLGDDMSTGPGCMASGIVKFGSRIRMGTGVFVEPYLEIGDDVQVASGAVIMQSVPADHVVKVRIGNTTVVPAQRR